jgi:crotonobetainyl-CoA:carnitine CoA-transferase CaiB-like acyl-CoA transferase
MSDVSPILAGIRVLDFGRYVAGPWCAQLLQGLGADVVRVERPSGGEDRFLFPFTSDVGAYFVHCNRGKRAITLNPTKPAGRAIVAKLITTADVIVANVPDDSLIAMGLDWETVHGLNPRCVLATASTFGTTGPYAGRLGFDGIAQVMSGSVHLSGQPDGPIKAFAPWVDYGTASNLAFGIVGALYGRVASGLGVRVEASLLGTALAATGHVITEQAVLAPNRVAIGNRHPAAGPSDIISTIDGRILVQVVGGALFARWCALIGRPEFVDDPRFATDDLRGINGTVLSEAMSQWCANRSTARALDELAGADIPAGPMLTPQQALDDPHVSSVMMDSAIVDGVDGQVPVVSHPLRFTNGSVPLGSRAPSLSEHTNEILRELGLNEGDIESLRSSRII